MTKQQQTTPGSTSLVHWVRHLGRELTDSVQVLRLSPTSFSKPPQSSHSISVSSCLVSYNLWDNMSSYSLGMKLQGSNEKNVWGERKGNKNRRRKFRVPIWHKDKHNQRTLVGCRVSWGEQGILQVAKQNEPTIPPGQTIFVTYLVLWHLHFFPLISLFSKTPLICYISFHDCLHHWIMSSLKTGAVS